MSSDGHAIARMPEWRNYLPTRVHDEFDAFCELYRQHGSKNFDPPALKAKLDPEVAEAFYDDMVSNGRVEGVYDVNRRLIELDREGIAGEVLFPDFGLAFQLMSPLLQSLSKHGYQITKENESLSFRAYNRWVADYCSAAPDRFAPMALIDFSDVDAAVAEIRAVRDLGLRGIVLSRFEEERPVYDPRFDPIWSVLKELDMPVNSHTGISSITDRPVRAAACAGEFGPVLMGPILLYLARQFLHQFIWGGVLERHPKLRLVMTEMQTQWVAPMLGEMDYSYSRSYLRRDVRKTLKLLPSAYFNGRCLSARRCSLAARSPIVIFSGPRR